jgi:hypothetical protein
MMDNESWAIKKVLNLVDESLEGYDEKKANRKSRIIDFIENFSFINIVISMLFLIFGNLSDAFILVLILNLTSNLFIIPGIAIGRCKLTYTRIMYQKFSMIKKLLTVINIEKEK